MSLNQITKVSVSIMVAALLAVGSASAKNKKVSSTKSSKQTSSIDSADIHKGPIILSEIRDKNQSKEVIPTLVYFNKGYDSFTKKAAYPYHVFIEFEVMRSLPNHYPTPEELDRLFKIETEIVKFLQKTQIVHWIASVQPTGGYRHILLYMDKPKYKASDFEALLNQARAKGGVKVEIENDPEWKSVGAFLE